ncbi:response regulator [Planctobacterium marinum]|uniref:response regulator n=1 Tax=Planctobacterium marinum TaxID=1631968 RepID=UPI001E498959|nr:response regulator transcription factor [Planctobacterium marinum]MCC2606798.1 response regulator transcription factor [Planctobacterium marinum]
MIRVALLDDHELVRTGFVQLLEQEADIAVVFHTSTVADAITLLCQHPVDIVVTDISLQSDNGFTLLEHIAGIDNPPKSIVLSMHDSAPYARKALDIGAQGYLSKASAPEALIDAIHAVHQGQTFIDECVHQALDNSDVNELDSINQLTERERQIFDCLAKGMEIKHIARELDIAVKTVHVHRTRLLNKLGAFNSFELTKMALRNGLLEAESLHN